MSIVRSTKSVSMTSNGVSRPIPIDHNYTSVCQYNLVPSEKDISAIFNANSDYYYRKVLETVGNNGDYKHYTEDGSLDPRCNCILCWTYRRSWSPPDYPSTRAKFLCMADQMRKDYVSRDMPFEQFERLTASYRFGSLNEKLTRASNVHLWRMLFPGTPLNTRLNVVGEVNDIVDNQLQYNEVPDELKIVFGDIPSNSEIRLSGKTLQFSSSPQYIESVDRLRAVCEGDNFTDDLEEQIQSLQIRVDKEYRLGVSRNKLLRMTQEEVEVSHQKMLDMPAPKGWFDGFSSVGLIVKHMFLHRFILENIDASSGISVSSRIRNNRQYKLFNGVRTAEMKEQIFSSRISRGNALISAASRGFFFHDPELRHIVRKQYYAFNTEFLVFLNHNERESFASIFELEGMDLEAIKIRKSFIKHVQKCETEYKIQKVEMELEKHKKKSDEEVKYKLYYIFTLRKAIRQIQLEKSILAGRFDKSITTHIDCKGAVRLYIKKLWNELRNGMGRFGADRLVMTEEYKAKLNELVERNRLRYIDDFVTTNMKYLYSWGLIWG